jgi:hypothetical protein
MSDIKLFRTGSNGVDELKGTSVALEKSLQTLIEKHLDTFLRRTFPVQRVQHRPRAWWAD